MDKNSTIQKLKREIMEANEIYRAAMETFGEIKQTNKLHEEIGEFMAAFGQFFEGRDKLSHVAEEMADVHNMLDQWALHLGCTDEVERQKRYKLRRLEQRVEEYKGKENKPLTFEELKGMIGEPVWVVPLNGSGYWTIASESLLTLYAGFLAYRSKPEEVQKNV